jgi:hypothetical protein
MARFRRWLKHDAHTLDGWFLPVAKALLENLAHQPLLLAIDGSVVGRGCIALMVSVIYHGRALPLAWVVVKGKKGHFPQAMHCALLDQLQPLLPQTAEVVVLGDGEFDGTDLQALLRKFGWQYVCRTAPNLLMTVYGSEAHIGRSGANAGRVAGGAPGVDDGRAVWASQHSGDLGSSLRRANLSGDQHAGPGCSLGSVSQTGAD